MSVKGLIPREAVEQNKEHEGYRKHVYLCSTRHATFGYGFNIDAGIDEDIAEILLEAQMTKIYARLIAYRWFYELDEVRRCVIVEMVYNIGWTGFHKFVKTIDHIKNHDYQLAAKEMLNSKWARQVPNRARKLSKQFETGNWS